MSISSADSHVQVVIELLQAEPDTTWSISGSPRIRDFFDDASAEKGPGANQPPVIYVYSPTAATLERHSMDDAQFYRENTAQILIMSLSQSQVVDVQNDVINILSEYLQDNRNDTPFNDLAPTAAADNREQKEARLTDHFVAQVTVETRNLPLTGRANL
jgi:hypothetical protein